MTFLNAILLAGAAAFLIPLLIHLLNKRRVQTVRWGAMHLLHEVLKQRKRKLRIEQLLLLLTRIAIPIVLALCLARPVITALRSLGLGKTSLVVLLDDSFSMRAPSAGGGRGGSLAQEARQHISHLMENLPPGSDVQVIMGGGSPRRMLNQSTSLLDKVTKQLGAVPSLSGPLSVEEIFQSAATSISKAPNAARELVVISDFQKRDWQAVADGAALPPMDSLLKQEPAPAATFFRLTSDLTENLAIAGAELSAQVVATGQPIGTRVRVRNHGKRPWQDVAVHLEADGARLRTSRISLPPEGESIINFTHGFDKVGDHSLTVRIEGDSFPDDNAFHAVVQVRNQLNVLLVDGSPSKEPLGGAADFLELALTPYQSTAATLKDLIHTTLVDARKLREQDWAGKEVVILADVDRLQGNRVNELDKFVRGGGGLFVFAGPHCDLDWYQREFFRKGQGLYPASFKGLQRADAGAARLLQQRLTHPATTYFNDARGGRLQDAEFRTWLKLEPMESSTVLFQLDSGAPLVLEKAVGRGRVIAAATTANAEWSNLPLQPFFVPLMQRLVSYLATQNTAPAWQRVGTPLRLTLTKSDADTDYTLRDPSGQTQILKPHKEADLVILESPPILQSGIFQLSRAGAAPALLAYNVDPAESDLTSLPAEEVKRMAERHQAAYVDSFEAYAKLDSGRRHGSELWQPFLLALLALLFFEVLLQQRIAKG